MTTDFTKIKNTVLQGLISAGLNGTELSCALFVYRKTIGWGKPSDQISLSQFTKNIPSTRPSIIKALNILKVVKVIILCKKGTSSGASNEWAFNENVASWQVVKKSYLVKKIEKGSKEKEKKVVKKPLHTKETITKETIQKKEPLTKVTFKQPSLINVEEFISEYINEKKYTCSATATAEDFYDYYSSNGWTIGKTGKSLKDWKAASRKWVRNAESNVFNKPSDSSTSSKTRYVTL